MGFALDNGGRLWINVGGFTFPNTRYIEKHDVSDWTVTTGSISVSNDYVTLSADGGILEATLNKNINSSFAFGFIIRMSGNNSTENNITISLGGTTLISRSESGTGKGTEIMLSGAIIYLKSLKILYKIYNDAWVYSGGDTYDIDNQVTSKGTSVTLSGQLEVTGSGTSLGTKVVKLSPIVYL